MWSRLKQWLKWSAIAVVAILIGIQAIRLNRTNPPITRNIKWDSPQTQSLAQRVPAGGSAGITGGKNWNQVRTFGITMAVAYPTNLGTSGVAASMWKHNEWPYQPGGFRHLRKRRVTSGHSRQLSEGRFETTLG